MLGETVTALPESGIGRWVRAHTLTVRLQGGALVSRNDADVLAGRNMLAVATPDGWEILQFQRAELTAPGEYVLSGLLRGQFGTDAVMAPLLAAGYGLWFLMTRCSRCRSRLQNSAHRSQCMPALLVNRAAIMDGSLMICRSTALPDGPIGPVHLRAVKKTTGLQISWIRRTRTGGDDWTAPDVPLGEDREKYRLSFFKAGATKPFKRLEVAKPRYHYPK